MKLKILLIDAINKERSLESALPPLGLGYLASSLRQAFGSDSVELKIIDENIDQTIKQFKPQVVGLTAVSQNYNLAIKYARVVKRYGLPVIIGGVHISALPQTLANEMDIGIIGEGETTIVELFKLYLKTGKFERGGLRNINGIVFREKGKIVLTPKRKPILPLDKIPLPARDLMTIGKTTAMLTSRGCPYRCTFCASSRFWNKVRFFSARYVVQEIKHLFENYQVNHISFWDDLFVADRERLKKIYTLLKKEGLLGQLSFSGSVRSNLVDEELAQLLSKMNFQGVTMGLESASPPVLKYLKGSTINVDQHTRALRILNRHGIKPSASFIIGSPHETRAEILQTLKFIKKSPLHSFDTYVLTPLPGTPVWEHAKEKGLVGQNMDWSTLDVDFTQNHKKAVILSEKLTRRELYRLFKKFKREQKRRLIVYALKNSQKIPKYLAGAMRRKLHGHLSRVRRSALP